MLVSLSIPLYISLIKSTNNKGPRMEPCGTPDRTSINSELQLSKITAVFYLASNLQRIWEDYHQYYIDFKL